MRANLANYDTIVTRVIGCTRLVGPGEKFGRSVTKFGQPSLPWSIRSPRWRKRRRLRRLVSTLLKRSGVEGQMQREGGARFLRAHDFDVPAVRDRAAVDQREGQTPAF
jgi:hypothetical protein